MVVVVVWGAAESTAEVAEVFVDVGMVVVVVIVVVIAAVVVVVVLPPSFPPSLCCNLHLLCPSYSHCRLLQLDCCCCC
jgi:hypothetical protein